MSGSSGSPVAAFRLALLPASETRALARVAREPDLKQSMDAFRKAVERAPDIKAALRDPRVLQVIGTALGVPQAASQPGLASRALLSDLADPKSVANTLSDKRWREAAASLKLTTGGIKALRDPKVQATLLDGLQRARLREEQDAQTPGLGDAVEFTTRASRAHNSIDVLGDAVLRRVVTGAIGLPPQLAIQSVEAQARAVDSRFKVEKLQNPAEARRLAERYLISLQGSDTGSTTTATGSLPGVTPAGTSATQAALSRFGFNV